MDKEKRHLLRKKRFYLIKKLTVDEDFLSASAEIFPPTIMENIKAKDTNSRKADIYLDELPKRGPGKFDMFIDALFKTDQEHVAQELGYFASPLANGAAPPEVGGSGAVTEETLRVIYEDMDCNQTNLHERPPRRGELRPSDSLDAGLGELAGEHEEEPPLPGKWPSDEGVPVNTSVKQVSDKEHVRARLENRIRNGHAYDLMLGRSQHRGRAILVHNITFSGEGKDKGLKDRRGSREDELALTSLFSNLGVDCKLYENKTAEEIRNALHDESQNERLAHIPMLFVVVMSHGGENVIFGRHGDSVSHQDIINSFNSERCPLLRGKPKIFLFQACQGNKPAMDLNGMLQRLSLDANRQEPDATPSGGAGAVDEFYPNVVGHHEDMLLVKACLFEHTSLRDPEWGTWFIQAFVEIVSTRAYLLDMLKLLTRVKQLVGKARSGEGYIQTTNSWSTLQKELYLCPGLH